MYHLAMPAMLASLEAKRDKKHLELLAWLTKKLLFGFNEGSWNNLLGQKQILTTLGILEYDPDIPDVSRVKHRKYLTEELKFQDIAELRNPDIKETIFYCVQLKYTLDVVLYVHGGTPIYLNTAQKLNKACKNVVDFLTRRSHWILHSVKRTVRETPQGSPTRKQAALMLLEMSTLKKQLPEGDRPSISFITKERVFMGGVLDFVAQLMSDPNEDTRVAAMEFLHSELELHSSFGDVFVASKYETFRTAFTKAVLENESEAAAMAGADTLLDLLQYLWTKEDQQGFRFWLDQALTPLIHMTSFVMNRRPNGEIAMEMALEACRRYIVMLTPIKINEVLRQLSLLLDTAKRADSNVVISALRTLSVAVKVLPEKTLLPTSVLDGALKQYMRHHAPGRLNLVCSAVLSFLASLPPVHEYTTHLFKSYNERIRNDELLMATLQKNVPARFP